MNFETENYILRPVIRLLVFANCSNCCEHLIHRMQHDKGILFYFLINFVGIPLKLFLIGTYEIELEKTLIVQLRMTLSEIIMYIMSKTVNFGQIIIHENT